MEVRFGWSYGKFRKTMGLRNRDCTVQYVVLGPRLKVINLNVLPESSCNELKYSLKIAFMFLSIILKFQVPDTGADLGGGCRGCAPPLPCSRFSLHHYVILPFMESVGHVLSEIKQSSSCC